MNHITPRKARRGLCGVPTDNHEVILHEGAYECRACDFIGDLADGTRHIIERQFGDARATTTIR